MYTNKACVNKTVDFSCNVNKDIAIAFHELKLCKY